MVVHRSRDCLQSSVSDEECRIMIVTGKHLRRRTVLRGIGTALCLPFLDAMVPAFGRAHAAAPVHRFGAVYVPNGMNMFIWLQPTAGPLAINTILQPLANLKDRLVVIDGLDSMPAD